MHIKRKGKKLKEWKSYKKWISEARKEYKEYLRTGNTAYLAQAGEKLWNAFKIYLKEKSKEMNIRTKKDITKIIEKITERNPRLSKVLWELFGRTYQAHAFFYEGTTIEEAKEQYNIERIFQLFRKLKRLEVD